MSDQKYRTTTHSKPTSISQSTSNALSLKIKRSKSSHSSTNTIKTTTALSVTNNVIVKTRLTSPFCRCCLCFVKVKDFILKKILGFKEEPTEEFAQKMIFLVINLVGGVMMVLQGIFSKRWYAIILTVCFEIYFLLTIILFILFKYNKYVYHVLVIIFSFALNILFVFFIATQDEQKGILFNFQYTFMFIVIPVLNILLGGFGFFWIFFWFLIVASGLTVDLVFNFEPYADLNDAEHRQSMIVMAYVMMMITNGFMMGTTYYLKHVSNNERKIIERITESIAQLQLENEFIDKIMNNKSFSKVVDHFKTIIANMKTYRSFLPDTLVFSDDPDEEHENHGMLKRNKSTTSDQSFISTGSSTSIRSSSTNSLKSHRSSISDSRRTPGSSIKSREKKSDKRKEIYCEERYVTILQVYIDIDTENSFFENLEISAKFSQILGSITKQLKGTRGSIINFFGQSIFISWNSTRITMNAHKKAAEFSLKFFQNQKKEKNGVPIRISFGSSTSFAGNFGVTAFKRFNVLSPKLRKLRIYTSEYAKKYNSQILIDMDMQEKLKFDYILKQVDYIEDEKLDLFELVGKKERREDNEWMYVINDSLKEIKSDELGNYDKAWELYKEQNYFESQNILKNLGEDKYTKFLMKKILSKM